MEYYVAADYKVDNFHITVRRPVLTPEETARRMEIIKAATVKMGIAMLEAEARRKKGA